MYVNVSIAFIWWAVLSTLMQQKDIFYLSYTRCSHVSLLFTSDDQKKSGLCLVLTHAMLVGQFFKYLSDGSFISLGNKLTEK